MTRPGTRIAVIAAAAALAIVVPAVVLSAAVPSGPVSVALTPASADGVPLPLVAKGRGDGVVRVPVLQAIARIPDKTFAIRFGTYFAKPSARIVVRFTGSDGKAGTSCRFAPLQYRDSSPVGCRLKRGERPAVVEIRASGAKGELAVWGSQSAAGESVGRWFQPASGNSLEKRVDFAAGAIDAVRPSGFGVPLLVIALALAGVLAAVVGFSLFGPQAAAGERPDEP